MTTSRLAPIYPGNDWTAGEIVITEPALATGAREAADGLTGISAWLSATDRGATIHADLTRTLVERSGVPGTYFAIWEGADTLTHLDSAMYWNKHVYLVIDDGGNILTSNPVLVKRARRA